MIIAVLFIATFFLAYNNGANDNFKGVATIYGSGLMDFKPALWLATFAIIAGSISAIFVANGLVASFSGKGLVPQDIAGTTDFLIAVGFGAGTTVLLATRLGFPISTTHALVGSLVGTGFMAVGFDINIQKLSGAFVIPLLVSPFIAFALGIIVYSTFIRMRKKMGISKESCVCLGKQKEFVPIKSLSNEQAVSVAVQMNIINPNNLHVEISNHATCVNIYTKKMFGFSIQKVLDSAHILSGAAVSFARGLNDTPKIAGLLVAAKAYDIRFGLIAIALGMAIGGLLNSRKVAETMSKKITTLNHGQGFSANLVTSFLVIVASKFGVPVSTTHVSVGAIFGIGMVTKNSNPSVVKSILLSWVITLPVGMFFSALAYWIIS